MELLGSNHDGSGFYMFYLDGHDFVTEFGTEQRSLEELARQPMSRALEDPPYVESDWYDYGDNGHELRAHYSEPVIRIDGVFWELGADSPS